MMVLGDFGIGHGQSGFTPVRRPESTINLRVLNGEPEKEWTATRCNRLLRALTSRIALLRKDLSRIHNGAAASETNIKATIKRKRIKDIDEEWNKGSYTKKRVKRTYSGRQATGGVPTQIEKCSSNRSSRCLVGEISVPTPFLNRARGNNVKADSDPAIPFLHSFTLDNTNEDEIKSKRRYRKEELAQYQHQYNTYMYEFKRKGLSASVYSIYEGIFNGLESLLRATTSDSKLKPRGSGSLFDICLRAVPRYILDEEKLLENELAETRKTRTIDSTHVSTEIYDDLEGLGSSGRGWKHLRTVVRAHGVQVVKEAMSTGLLETEFCSVLINLCFQTHATIEGETLLSALLSTVVFPPPQSIITHSYRNNSTIPLSILWSTTEPGVSVSFQFKQLSDMISDNRLPLSWLATKDFSPVWKKAMEEISSQTINAEIQNFLVVALEKLTMLPARSQERRLDLAEEVDQAFSSILYTITSIVIISQEIKTKAHHVYFKPVKYEHIIRLLRRCLVEWENSDSCNPRGSLLLLANLSVGSVPDDTHSEFCLTQRLLKEIRKDKGLVGSNLVEFICSIASYCGKGMSTKGFEYLKQLHATLESLQLTQEPDGGNLFHELIIDSSFAFAQQALNSEYLDYAIRTEAKFHGVKTGQGSGETPSRSGCFRWEDGIGEWVSATPAVNKSRHPIQPLAKQQSDSNATRYSTVTSRHIQTKVSNYMPDSPISLCCSDASDGEVSHMRQQSPNSSFANIISTSSQSSILSPTSSHRTACAPNLNDKISKQASRLWEVFTDYESEDELSFCDASSCKEPVLQIITNASHVNKQRPAIENLGKVQKRKIRKSQRKIEDSADELGM